MDCALMKIKFKVGQIASDIDDLSYFPLRKPLVVEITDEQADYFIGEITFVSILLLAIIPLALIILVPGPDIRQSGTFKAVDDRVVFTDIVDLTPPHPMEPYALFCVVVGWLVFLTGIFWLHKVLKEIESPNYPILLVKSRYLFPFES